MYLYLVSMMLMVSTCLYSMDNAYQLMMKTKTEEEKESVLNASPIDLRLVTVNRSGANLLHWAASKGHFPVMKVLIEQELFNVNAQTREQYTPLDYAYDVPTVQYLLEAGAQVTEGEFMRVMHRDSLDVAKFLFKHRARQMSNASLVRCFSPAIEKGDSEMCEILLKSGILPLNYQLSDAVSGGHVDIVTVFERHGIDILKASRESQTGKSFAALAYMERDKDMLKKMLKTVDDTAFKEATFDAWPEGFKLLLKSGVKPDKDIAHDMLLNAINERSTECIAILLDSRVLPVQLIDIMTAMPAGIDGLSTALMVHQLLSYCGQHELDSLLIQAVESCNSNVCRVLLETGASPIVRTKEGLTLLHVIVKKLAQFHITEHPHTKREDLEMQRTASISWLREWKDVLTDSSLGLYKATTAPEKLFEIVRFLLLVPIYKSLPEHRAQVREMLKATCTKKYDKKRVTPLALNPFEMAKRQGLAYNFTDLIDPEKLEQWYYGMSFRY